MINSSSLYRLYKHNEYSLLSTSSLRWSHAIHCHQSILKSGIMNDDLYACAHALCDWIQIQIFYMEKLEYNYLKEKKEIERIVRPSIQVWLLCCLSATLAWSQLSSEWRASFSPCCSPWYCAQGLIVHTYSLSAGTLGAHLHWWEATRWHYDGPLVKGTTTRMGRNLPWYLCPLLYTLQVPLVRQEQSQPLLKRGIGPSTPP